MNRVILNPSVNFIKGKGLMSWNRFFSSTICVAVVLAGIFFEWAFMLVIIGLTIGGLYEFFYMIKKKGI